MTIGFIGAVPAIAASTGAATAGGTAAGIGLGGAMGGAAAAGGTGTGLGIGTSIGGLGVGLGPSAASTIEGIGGVGELGLGNNLSWFEHFGKFMSDPNISMTLSSLGESIDPKGVGGALGKQNKQMIGAKSEANLLQRLLGDSGEKAGITGKQLMSKPSGLLNLSVR